MKRLSFIVFVVVAGLMMQPATGIPGDQDEFEPPEKAQEKDLCLLYASQCGTQVQSLQDKIYRLQEEIEKGTKVYTVEELRRLKHKLEEANRRLDLFFDE
jgi:hypothetical protein